MGGNSTVQLHQACKIDNIDGNLIIMKRLIPLALCAACAAAQPLPPETEDTCGANDRQALLGQDVTDLEKVLILGMVRVIRPGDMVTQDYRPERINFNIGPNETITSISCG